MSQFANTPKPPYYAVIFSSTLKENTKEYQDVSIQMEELALENEGFIGFEAARNEIGIFISYWKDLESIKKWKAVTEHRLAQQRGRSEWYKSFKVRISKVERDYGFEKG
jgi:heme-degrading monooxygenase HmoA